MTRDRQTLLMKSHAGHRSIRFLLSLTVGALLMTAGLPVLADAISDTPILFVTMVPNPRDFGSTAATFSNHGGAPDVAYRGGDLWIRYPDGTLKNLTAAAGYGNTGFQGGSSIAVRDPAVHWDGEKALFSMIVGAAAQRYQITNYRWQLYEISGLGAGETPVITKVAHQPEAYNNHSPAYASDDSIIFVSDRPRDDSVLHTYPQRDEYESSPVNSGLWKIQAGSGALTLLDHSPSGDFNPIVDSFGRVIFTRWDHLQRDQQNIGASLGAFNYESETSVTKLQSSQELFPEPRSMLDPEKQANVNLFTINQFFPWMMNQDGTDLETLNHVGRQEIGVYVERSFNDDPNVQEFYGQYATGANQNEFTIFLHTREDPLVPGTYLGTNCQEFGTHSAGQLLSISGAPGVNPDAMVVTYLTHPDTSGATATPSGDHSGLYRDPLPLSNGNLIASHTAETRQDQDIGTPGNPQSRYDFRLKRLNKIGEYYVPGAMLTSGISKSVSFWSPDNLISYNGPLWEMMPVELKSRARPPAHTLDVPPVEAGVIAGLGIDIEELRTYLRAQNLALVVSRDVTSRDRNDRQQPTNLRVAGSSTQSIPKSGKVYDVSHLEFFQGDLIRGYNNGSSSGRRVIAQRMHSVPSGANPQSAEGASGSVQIAEDGSMAAFVPARRALSWQLAAPNGSAVVRERYWVTFQPGEVRVCASCHGVNTADQLGRGVPVNPPLALERLLQHWKNLPSTNPGGGGGGGNGYALTVAGKPKLKAGGRFTATASGGAAEDLLQLRVSIGKKRCAGSRAFSTGSESRVVEGKMPGLPGVLVKFELQTAGADTVHASQSVKLKGRAGAASISAREGCKRIMKSLR